MPKSPRPNLATLRGSVGIAVAVAVASAVALGLLGGSLLPRLSYTPRAAQKLAPTPHPPIPDNIDHAWLVPAASERQRIAQRPAVRALRSAADAVRDSRYADALTALDDAKLAGTPLEPYTEYYRALSDLRLRRPAPARERLAALRKSLSAGRLRQLALSAEAEAALSTGDPAAAATLLEELYPGLTQNRDVTLDQWATAARAAGRPHDAARLWLRLYYEFPTSQLAPSALRQAETTLQAAAVGTPDTFPRDLTRAEALLAAGRVADGAAALKHLDEIVTGSADGAQWQAYRDRLQLRLAQAACLQQRCGSVLAMLDDLATRGVGNGEAQYLRAMALRESSRAADYHDAVEALVAVAPGTAADAWVERALNEYGTYLIKASRDEEAAALFRRLFDRNPSGRHAERAAWKYGWWSYRQDRFEEAVRVFESASASFPRANTRPAWLYWAGRGREALGDRPGATQRLAIVVLDYMHSYYGRLASEALARLDVRVPTSASAPRPDVIVTEVDGGEAEPGETTSDIADANDTGGMLVAAEPPPTADLISWLVSAGLYSEAVEEMKHAQRAHGRMPQLDATLAWVYKQQGEIRPAINTMRQAYPQYLSASGDALPREIQEVIFPLAYAPLIKRYAAQNALDPFIVAALIGQESSYVADVRSPANAWGLMQILPSTGARLARVDGVRRFRTRMLTDPETNIRLGTRHFAGLVRDLGGVPFALAGYNAGAGRVVRWKAERGPLEQAEFIDDIPFPETQIYVKKIMGTAVDYRRLYGKVLGE